MAKTTTRKIKKLLIVGNWKLNPQTEAEAQKLFVAIKKEAATKTATTEIALCAPFVFIGGLYKHIKSGRVALGAQDVFFEDKGAFTGEVSVSMIKNMGVTHVIVGHSERRLLGETNEFVAKKTAAAILGGMTTLVCVGETVRDTQGDYFTFVETQLKAVFLLLKKSQLRRLVIAYEPVWAIGTGVTPSAEDVQEMKLFIQKILVHHFDRTVVSKVRIVYGGSVSEANTGELLVHGHVDGFLVGGASLKPVEFGNIIKISDQYGS